MRKQACIARAIASAFLGPDTGIGAGRVDEAQHRQVEPVGEVHQPDGLAIALGSGHPEIVLQAGLDIMALLMADDRDGTAAKPAEAAQQGRILAEQPVAGQRHEIVDQPVDIMRGVRTVGMAGHLHLLPGGELLVALPQQTIGLRLQLGDLVGNVDLAIGGDVAQFLDLAFEFGDRFFEVQKGDAHGALNRDAGRRQTGMPVM